MTAKARVTRLVFILFPFSLFLFCALAAAPLPTDTPDDLIRRANEALRAGDAEGADQLYGAAEERTTDPGLVAFNRAGVLFEQKKYRDAERHYDRVLEDAACPPARSARAWYNRGTCLLNRGGTLEVYRAAIACFENALDNPAADPEVRDRAPHNLELAKLLWLEEARKAKPDQPPSPNNKIPEEENKLPRPEPDRKAGADQGTGTDPAEGGSTPRPGTQPQPVPQPNAGTAPKSADQNVAGPNANLQVIEDRDDVQQLSPEDARAYLEETRKRRKRELNALLETLYGPDRPGVRDW
jgi:tetratricopeptide (TPR) repeat protein